MNKVDIIIEILETRYKALTRTDITISKGDLDVLKQEIHRLRKDNDALNKRLALAEISEVDSKIKWS